MDNPSSYFTAQALNSRADDLSTLLDSIGQAISTLEVADKGITTLQEFVEQAKSIANSARDTANVASKVTSNGVTFNSATAKEDKLTDMVANVAAGDKFTIRLGTSTKMEGTSNVSADQKLSEIGVEAGVKMEMIVGDKTYKFSFGAAAADATVDANGVTSQTFDVNSTLEDFMKDVVYTVGRKVLNAEVKEGKLSFNTMDNSSLVIRSTAEKTGTFSSDNVYSLAVADIVTNAIGTDGAGAATGVAKLSVGGVDFDIKDGMTGQEIVNAINAKDELQSQGIYAGLNGTNVEIYKLNGEALSTADAPKVTAAQYAASTTGTAAGLPADGGTTAGATAPTFKITKAELQQLMGTKGDGVLNTAGKIVLAGDTTTNKLGVTLNAADIENLINGKTDGITVTNGTVSIDANGDVTFTATEAEAGKKIDATYTAQTYTAATDGADVATPAVSTANVDKYSNFSDIFGFDKGKTVTITDGMTVEQFRQAIDNLDGISADFDSKGHLVISGEQGDDMVIADLSGNVAKSLLGDSVVSATNGSNERAKYATQFNAVLDQVDQLVQDTSYKGINLLKGDNLTVVFNESRTSTLELKGVTFDSTGLGFTTALNEWIDNDSIDTALNQITKATSLLRAQASEFGQNLSTVQIREDFTENMVNNLTSGADKLTLADMNEEAANMLALQTRQQLGINSLSLASQASQSVLQLF